ncbi:hypothetical protein C8R43DRAFT_183830 [Mycena crocata]|nr:hypothetical protein C8R43DRAFT_183830 [Mycena crocata]
MNASSHPGRFPANVELQIFEMAVALEHVKISDLMTLSARIFLLLLPIRYRVLTVTAYTGRAPTYQFLQSRPDEASQHFDPRNPLCPPSWDFVRDAARHLCLHDVDYPLPFLDRCDRVVDLSLTIDKPREGLFIFLEHMRLKRLSTNITNLLEHFTCQWGTLNHLAFSNITHLTLFDKKPPSWKKLAQLPSLTHLCLSDRTEVKAIRNILKHLPNLEMLLTQWQALDEIQPKEYCRAARFKDPRFVMLETLVWVYEWELMARGRPDDMWDRARVFIDGKARGTISKKRFWLRTQLFDPGEIDDESDSDGEDGSDLQVNSASEFHPSADLRQC